MFSLIFFLAQKYPAVVVGEAQQGRGVCCSVSTVQYHGKPGCSSGPNKGVQWHSWSVQLGLLIQVDLKNTHFRTILSCFVSQGCGIIIIHRLHPVDERSGY